MATIINTLPLFSLALPHWSRNFPSFENFMIRALQYLRFHTQLQPRFSRKHKTTYRRTVTWQRSLYMAPPHRRTTIHHNHFTALFPGRPGWAAARRELLDFMVQGKINRGRHTDHPAGRHSIRTNQCPSPPSPIFLQTGCPSCRPTNSGKALKAPVCNKQPIS